jgi:perosamine synthetase
MIPVSSPHVGDLELAYVTNCLKSGWIGAGDYVAKFESDWARYCGRKFGVAVSNGTTALELAIKCLGIPPGKKVILPSFTIISCAIAVIRNGLVPVFVDSEPDTFCIDPAAVSAAIDEETAAVMVVHMYGHPAQMDELTEIARHNRLLLIEDAAEAHGATYKGKKCGSFGDVSCFSFYSNKIISTGEGGMVLTDNKEYAELLRSHRNLCFGVGKERFLHTGLGHNYRMTNLQAAIGCAQVEQIDGFLQSKKEMARCYNDGLGDVPVTTPAVRDQCDPVYWMYGILSEDAQSLMCRLRESDIDTRPFFHPLHEQPALRKYAKQSLPVAERISRSGFYLPSGVDLSRADQDRVISVVRSHYGF